MSEYSVSFQNQPVDVSEEFSKQESHFFLGSKVEEFDHRSATGKLWWKSMALRQRVSYHQVTLPLEDYRVWRDVERERS
jgi:alpha-D-xyloside xylohydrolase